MSETIRTNPAVDKHGRRALLIVIASIVVVVAGIFVTIGLVHAAQARHDQCMFDKAYQGYNQVQAAELCK